MKRLLQRFYARLFGMSSIFQKHAFRHARVSEWKNRTIVNRIHRLGLLNYVYYQLPKWRRSEAQSLLMGEAEAYAWAKHHFESREIATTRPDHLTAVFPPDRGESSVGTLDFRDAFAIFDYLNSLLADATDTLVIQLGTSSGKEIAWFAKQHPHLRFLGTDLFDTVADFANQSYDLQNLSFQQASAENLHLAVSSCKESSVIIFSNGSALYIFPESLTQMLQRLRKSRKTVNILFSEPNSLSLLEKKSSDPASQPGATMGYDHDYGGYGIREGFEIAHKIVAAPWPMGKYPPHQTDRVLSLIHLRSLSNTTSTQPI